jgi:hypothetical protein
MDRYGNLNLALRALAKRTRDLRYLEVGAYSGVRAASLLRQWLLGSKNRTAYYAGFDLFELLTPEMSKAELSKSTLPPAMSEVRRRLQAAAPQATIELFRGNTQVTLPAYVQLYSASPRPNLIWMDGGHSLETIASDWACCSELVDADTIVLLDDYYEHRDDYGCKKLVAALQQDPRWVVELPQPVDEPSPGVRIRVAKVTLAKAS